MGSYCDDCGTKGCTTEYWDDCLMPDDLCEPCLAKAKIRDATTDDELLKFALEVLNMTKRELIEDKLKKDALHK